MKKLWIPLLLAVLMLLCGAAPAEAPEMWIDVSGNEVLPGQAAVIRFSVPEDGVCTIRVENAEGKAVSTVAADRPVSAGYNSLYWNGTWEGYPAPAGEWRLVLEMNGRTAETWVSVGRMVPCLIAPALSETKVSVGRMLSAVFCATEAGEITVSVRNGEGTEFISEHYPAAAGDGIVPFAAAIPPGEYRVVLTLRRADGTESEPAVLPLEVREPAMKFSPVYTSPLAGGDRTLNGWTVPMDIEDQDAVWQALTAPVTVLDDRKSDDQRRQIVVRREPSADSDGVGMVTMLSQGVHVLERGEEWTLIECYSSSFHNSAVLNWNALIQGWVPTRYLKEVTPNQQMGIVVDKLTQRMYIFLDGNLYSSLLVSTGLTNERQPYNETRSGEFLLVSRVGGFDSDGLYCPLAIRFNAGDMMHEVPYVRQYNDYSRTEPKLGTRASHGCIRVQRRANPDGVNMQWIWNHYKANTKILIWEDWQGRQVPVPGDDTVFYTNTRRNNYYHSSDRCPELGTRNPRTISYGELCGEAGGKLRPCPACGPALKKDELAEINALYAEGGDHDPIMTKARENCPRLLKEK